jgi:hypothetical protein
VSATITITGTAKVTDSRTNKPLSDPDRLNAVGRLHYAEDLMSRYLDGDLDELEISGGDIRLLVHVGDQNVQLVSTFQAPRKLTAAQLKQLARNSVGQWSDGIGENCFGQEAMELGIAIDLVQSRTPKAEQTLVEEKKEKRPVARPSVLVKAAEAADLEKVKQLLAAGVNPNGKDAREVTALLCAAFDGHLEVVDALLAAGADVNAMSWSGTALNAAAHGAADKPDRNIAIARRLLDRGADPSLAENDWEGCRGTLSWAVSNGGHEFVRLLLDSGADPNQRDAMSNEVGGTDEMTPLMRATDPEIARMLLDAGADPSLRNSCTKAPTAAAYIRKMAREHGMKSELGKHCLAAAAVIDEYMR